MKKLTWFKTIALVAALGTFSASCAYVLHPERRNSGRTSGRLDTVPLVLDILWFLPGIIPGVVAIIVDFTTGAIYVDNSGARHGVKNSRLAIRIPAVNQPTTVTLKLLSADGRVLDQDSARVKPGDDPSRKLEVDVSKARQLAKADRNLRLELGGLGAPLQLPVTVQ